MNTTASTYETEHSWSRRCSTETVYSLQGKETDIARDTTDTDAEYTDTERGLEYEPVTEPEDEPLFDESTSTDSDNAIIRTKVIRVSIEVDGDLRAADSEWTDTYESDSEIDYNDYWQCAQCRTDNNNPLYRYCQKCFQVRKNLFPPRPKRKKRIPNTSIEQSSQESGFYTQSSQASRSQEDVVDGTSKNEPHTSTKSCILNQTNENLLREDVVLGVSQIEKTITPEIKSGVLNLTNQASGDQDLPKQDIVDVTSESNKLDSQESLPKSNICDETSLDPSQQSNIDSTFQSDPISNLKKLDRLKRRAESLDRRTKRARFSGSDSDSDVSIQPLVKTVSDPLITIDKPVILTKKAIANSLKENMDSGDMCVICVSEPKTGVFVHGRIAHICCCYKCAIKVWTKTKRCPICNSKVSNVLKAVVT